MTSPGLPTLADALDRRRSELGLRWEDVSALSGVARSSIAKIRNGSVPRQITRRDLERALQWEPFSIDAILAGGEPTPIADEPQAVETATLSELIEQLVDLTDTPEEAYDLLTQALLRRRQQDTPSDRGRTAG